MTLFAVLNAGLFPLLHLGRPGLFYYLLPYPNTLGLWPQWRSPLVWDVVAVMTYGLVSLLFWHTGLLPDLATMRDRAGTWGRRRFYAILSLGWRNEARQWHHHQMLYLLLAGLATPLVVSVHSIVSLDFSISIVPGWHTTIFPPYFVAGAIFSGFAMVVTLAVPLRWAFQLHDVITPRHFDAMGKVTLVSGLIVGYGYLMEHFTALFSGDLYHIAIGDYRMWGEYAYIFWITIFCNVVIPQALWSRRVRVSPLLMLVVAQFINIGMWTERFMIVVTSLARDYLSSSWGPYVPTMWDWALFLGTIGLFLSLLVVFIRLLPMISMYEIRELLRSLAAAKDKKAGAEEPLVNQQSPVGGENERPDYGLIAEYASEKQLISACRHVRSLGYQQVEAYTPEPVHRLSQLLGFRQSILPAVVLICGLAGAGAAYLMQWYSATIHYPLNIGGRPLHSWPSFIPLTFECGILGGAVGGFIALLALNRLPRLHHPVFSVVNFERASLDRFFLCVRGNDPAFEHRAVQRALEQTGPVQVRPVSEQG